MIKYFFVINFTILNYNKLIHLSLTVMYVYLIPTTYLLNNLTNLVANCMNENISIVYDICEQSMIKYNLRQWVTIWDQVSDWSFSNCYTSVLNKLLQVGIVWLCLYNRISEPIFFLNTVKRKSKCIFQS